MLKVPAVSARILRLNCRKIEFFMLLCGHFDVFSQRKFLGCF